MDLAGKNVLVTGAARGIGAATARDLATRGARLALVGLEPDQLAALTSELDFATGAQHFWAEADVTDSATLTAAVAQAVAALGGLDVVVANAGIASFGSVRTIDPEAFATTVDVNLTGVFRTVHATLEHLIDSRGHVLVVSSLAALVPMVGSSAYGRARPGWKHLPTRCASKWRRWAYPSGALTCPGSTPTWSATPSTTCRRSGSCGSACRGR